MGCDGLALDARAPGGHPSSVDTPPPLLGLPSRYVVEAPGAGAAGAASCWDGRDTALDRSVRIHVLDGPQRELHRQAIDLLTRLDHPGLLPLVDRGVTTAGLMWVVTRHPGEWDLGQILADHGSRSSAIVRDRLDGLLIVAEAVGAAHRQAVVHGAISAALISIDQHHAVLGGWQAALPIAARAPIPGDPATQSPEQARGEPVDARSDVFALGVILFQILTGRLPVVAADAATYARRRQAGEIDALGTDEAWVASTRMQSLAAATLHADPDRRPADGEAFASQLRAALADDGFSAVPTRPRNGPGVALMVGVMVILFAIGLFSLWRQGQLIGFDPAPVVHHFNTPAWKDSWLITSGQFAAEEDRLVHTGSQLGTIAFNQRLIAPVSIEFDAEMLPGNPAGDLSVIWYEQQPTTNMRFGQTPGYLLQTGAYDNQFAGIIRNPGGQVLDQIPYEMKQGQLYHIRVDVTDDALRLSVDGKLLCEHHAAIPFTSGWLGLMAYYSGKAFGPVRISTTTPRRQVPALSVGDALFRRGHWTDAAEEYAELAEVLGDDSLGQTARYRQGLALYQASRHNDAERAWEALSPGPLKQIARCLLLQRWSLTGSHMAVAQGLAELAEDANPDVHQAVRTQWLLSSKQLPPRCPPEMVDAFLAIVEKSFPDDALARTGASELCLRAGRFAAAIRWGKDARRTHIDALVAEGRPSEVLTTYPEDVQGQARALLQLGRFGEVVQRLPQVEWAVREANLIGGISLAGTSQANDNAVRIANGEAAAMLANTQRLSPDGRRGLLIALGSLDEATAELPAGGNFTLSLLRGRAADVLENVQLADRNWLEAAWCQWMQLSTAADPQAAQWLAQILAVVPEHRWGELWFVRDVMPALAQHGVPGLMKHAHEVAGQDKDAHADGQRAWHFSAYLIGQIDRATFLAQPAARQATSLVLLADGLRAEAAADKAGAQAAYQAFLALAPWQRPTDDGTRQVWLESCAQWRLEVLEPPAIANPETTPEVEP